MKILKIFVLAISLISISFASANSVKAQVTPPDFPLCSNPQGTIKVNYDSGVHGIPGDPNAYSGSDSVYTIDADRTQQCFCSEAGNGIQTNWWKVNSLNQEEIDSLVKLGWNFIPSGSVWGLDASAYMAFNSTYSCASTNSTATSSGSDNIQGNVLAAATSTGGSVLGLAATGNLLTIAFYATLGVISLLFGIILKRSRASSEL